MVECKGCHPKKLTGLTQTAVSSARVCSGRRIPTDRVPRADFVMSPRGRPVPIPGFAHPPYRPAPIAGYGSPMATTSAPRLRRTPIRARAARAIPSEVPQGRNKRAIRIRFLFPAYPLPAITSFGAQGNKAAPKGQGFPRPSCHASPPRYATREAAGSACRQEYEGPIINGSLSKPTRGAL